MNDASEMLSRIEEHYELYQSIVTSDLGTRCQDCDQRRLSRASMVNK